MTTALTKQKSHAPHWLRPALMTLVAAMGIAAQPTHAQSVTTTSFTTAPASTTTTSAAAVDLLDTLRWAQSHDPQYAAAQAQREASLAARAQRSPLWDAQTRATVATGLGGQDVHLTNARAMGQSGVGLDASINAGWVARVGVGAQKPIRNPALEVQSDMLETRARIGEVQWAQAQQDLTWRVVQTYLDVLGARQTIDVLQRQHDTLVKAQQEITRRQAIGDATLMDVQEAQARVALVHAQVLQAQHELDTHAIAYRQLTGQMPAALRGVATRQSDAATLPSLSQCLMQAQTQSTQLQSLDLQITLQEEEAKRIQLAGRAATLDWVGQAQMDRLSGYGMNGLATQQLAGYVVGVQWSAPLGAQNLTQAREQEALKQADKLRVDKQLAQAQLESQVTEAWQAVQSSQARLQALAQAHSLNQQRVRTTRRAHQLGTRSTLEWLGAEQDAAQAELLWQQMRLQVVRSQARLWWVSGALGDSEVQRLNQQLQ